MQVLVTSLAPSHRIFQDCISLSLASAHILLCLTYWVVRTGSCGWQLLQEDGKTWVNCETSVQQC